MRRLLSLVLGTLVLSIRLASAGEPTVTEALIVEGMKCEKCEPKAEAALRKVPGVEKAKVNYSSRTAAVVFDAEKIEMEQLVAALKRVGFTASPAQARYICPKCQATYQAGGACLICEASLQPISSADGETTG